MKLVASEAAASFENRTLMTQINLINLILVD